MEYEELCRVDSEVTKAVQTTKSKLELEKPKEEIEKTVRVRR